jgi:hypothetical protein
MASDTTVFMPHHFAGIHFLCHLWRPLWQRFKRAKGKYHQYNKKEETAENEEISYSFVAHKHLLISLKLSTKFTVLTKHPVWIIR